MLKALKATVLSKQQPATRLGRRHERCGRAPVVMKVNDLLKAQRKPSKQRDTIVFSEAARKSYVTGFKKRKDERREIARRENEKKARDAKVAARKEKREALAFALSGGIANRRADETADEAQGAPPRAPARKPLSTKRHVFENTLTTTTVTPLVDSSDPAFILHAGESSEAVAARLAVRRSAQLLKRSAELDKRAKMRAQKAKGGSKGVRKPKAKAGAAKVGKKGKGRRVEKGGRQSAGTKGSRGRK